MPGQYETANITYKGLEDKGLTFTLIDEKKGKWTLWKKDYKDKEKDSDAWASLQSLKMGDTFGVSYQEKDESFTDKKTGKPVNFKRKTIYSIMPPITHPTSEMTTSPNKGFKSAPSPVYSPTDDDKPDWTEINIGKCQFGFLQAYIQSGHSFSEAKLQAVQARQLAELVVHGQQRATDEPPIGEAPPEVSGEDVPF